MPKLLSRSRTLLKAGKVFSTLQTVMLFTQFLSMMLTRLSRKIT